MAVNVNINTSTLIGECNENDCGEKVKMDCCQGNGNVPDKLLSNKPDDEIFIISSQPTGFQDIKNDDFQAQKNLSIKSDSIFNPLPLRVSVLEITFDENNNQYASNLDEPNCWFKFLSILCFCRMSGDVLKKVETARVQDYETRDRENGSKFTVYKVEVHTGSSNWHVFRRYTEFQKLNDLVKKKVPSVQLKLPGRKLFGCNLNRSSIAERQGGLDLFVQELIRHSLLLHLPEVRDFFLLENLNDPNEKNESSRVRKSKSDLNPKLVGRSGIQPKDFQFLAVIGQGSFGKVFLAKHRNEGKLYAVKVLNKYQVLQRNEAKHIMTERNVLLKNLDHPFLVGLHYSFQTFDKLYFVLDYINGGELFFHLQNAKMFGEERSRFYASEIACAIGYLHSKGIIYRDLKPENVLLDSEGHIVLTDFGLSKEGLGVFDTTNTFCGTPEYLAPEIILKKDYDRSVDWWCLGVILHEMLFGWPPFYCKDTSKMYERIVNSPLILNSTISENARSILTGLLKKDRAERLGSGHGDFQDIKIHPFFHGINWDDLIAKKIKPPYRPEVKSRVHLSYIDLISTRERMLSSINNLSDRLLRAHIKEMDEMFADFSYTPNSMKLSS